MAEGELTWRSSEWESWPCPSPVAALGRVGPLPHLGSSVELTLNVRVVEGKQTQVREYERVSPASCLLDSGADEREIPSSLPSSLAIYGRQKTWTADHEMLELTVSLTCCNTQESEPCTIACEAR